MHYLYILKSLKDLGYYIGITDNVPKRLKDHNRDKTRSTKNRVPFVIKYAEKFNTKREARQREIFLKRNCQARKALLTKLGFTTK